MRWPPTSPAGSTLKKLLSLPLLCILSVAHAEYHIIDVPKAGAIEGVVKFPGETPPPAMWTNPDEHDCPHGIGQNHLIVQQTNLGLKNALIILESTQGIAASRRPANLTLERCTLTPRI